MIDTNKYEETDHPELVEFEGETLGDTLTNLLAEVMRLREQVGNLSDKVVLLESTEAMWYSMLADELEGDYND